MTDRELLELAAKAAGYSTAHYFDGEFMGADRYEFCDGSHGWDPLTSDGDALRLAVKLKMTIEINEIDDNQWLISLVKGRYFSDQESGDDPYAATRRAIVLAAAEIGAKL